jgi:hypothetical protein
MKWPFPVPLCFQILARKLVTLCNMILEMVSYLLNVIKDIHIYIYMGIRVRVMVLKSTFNNISVISWQPVLLVEETVVPRENLDILITLPV